MGFKSDFQNFIIFFCKFILKIFHFYSQSSVSIYSLKNLQFSDRENVSFGQKIFTS